MVNFMSTVLEFNTLLMTVMLSTIATGLMFALVIVGSFLVVECVINKLRGK